MTNIICALIMINLCAVSFPVFAISSFLDKWREVYPSSSAGDINCQLCHVSREGGSPWNSYGRQVRNSFLSQSPSLRSIEEALAAVETLDADEDELGQSNLVEINNNTQPGWKAGQTNLAYDRFDQVVGVFFPPVTIDPIPTPIPIQSHNLELRLVATGFTSPLAGVLAPGPANANYLFVVDQIGEVWRLNLINGERSRFLDLSARLVALGAFTPGGYDERGLLGFAFHPNFVQNGRVYSYSSQPANRTPDFTTLSDGQTANHQSVVTEHILSLSSLDDGEAVIVSERELLRLDQPQFNHNGGDLQFDTAGNLYVSVGDGGGADDQGVGHGLTGNGANPSNPYGAILRIDPLGNNSLNGRYGIPMDNPFRSDASRLDEIFAFGFRNPWKMWFDVNGDLYTADVGQNDIEEINKIDAGGHYGWRIREGSFFFDPNGDQSGLVTREIPDNLPNESLIDPIVEYDHDEGISTSGGRIYRGSALPPFKDQLIMADFQKRLFAANPVSGAIAAFDLNPKIFIYSVANDHQNELYIMGNMSAETSGKTGEIYKLNMVGGVESRVELCMPIKTVKGAFSVVCI